MAKTRSIFSPEAMMSLEHIAHETVLPVTSIIGGDVELVACAPGLLLEDEHLLRPRPDDRNDSRALFLERLGDGVNDPDAHASADADGRFDAVDLRGVPQGPEYVLDDIAGVELRKLVRRLPDDLVDDRQRPLHRVGVDDGQGDPLPLVVDHENDELAGFSLFRDIRRLEDRLDDVLGENDFFRDPVQRQCPPYDFTRGLGSDCSPSSIRYIFRDVPSVIKKREPEGSPFIAALDVPINILSSVCQVPPERTPGRPCRRTCCPRCSARTCRCRTSSASRAT